MAQLKPLVMMIYECCLDAPKHHAAVFEKYSSPKYKRASTYVAGELNKGFKPSLAAPAQLSNSSHAFQEDFKLAEYSRANLLISSES